MVDRSSFLMPFRMSHGCHVWCGSYTTVRYDAARKNRTVLHVGYSCFSIPRYVRKEKRENHPLLAVPPGGDMLLVLVRFLLALRSVFSASYHILSGGRLGRNGTGTGFTVRVVDHPVGGEAHRAVFRPDSDLGYPLHRTTGHDSEVGGRSQSQDGQAIPCEFCRISRPRCGMNPRLRITVIRYRASFFSFQSLSNFV